MCWPMGKLRPQTGESLVKFCKVSEYKIRRIESEKDKYVFANGAAMALNRGIPYQKFLVRIYFIWCCVEIKF